jgi:kinesin family protein 11
MVASSAGVQVVVRLRPLNEREKQHGTLPVISASTNDKTVTVIKGTGNRQARNTYAFDNVFTSFSTQEEVFDTTIKPVIKDVLTGYESTVFAYGQTGKDK